MVETFLITVTAVVENLTGPGIPTKWRSLSDSKLSIVRAVPKAVKLLFLITTVTVGLATRPEKLPIT